MLLALLLAAAPPEPSLSPTLIEAVFAENELGAEKRFAKPVRVVGILDSVARDILGAPFLTLRSANGSISCFLTREAEKRAAALTRGELVQVIGEAGRRRAIRGVTLMKCRVLWAQADEPEIDPLALNTSAVACAAQWMPDAGLTVKDRPRYPCTHPLIVPVFFCARDESEAPECRQDPLKGAVDIAKTTPAD